MNFRPSKEAQKKEKTITHAGDRVAELYDLRVPGPVDPDVVEQVREVSLEPPLPVRHEGREGVPGPPGVLFGARGERRRGGGGGGGGAGGDGAAGSTRRRRRRGGGGGRRRRRRGREERRGRSSTDDEHRRSDALLRLGLDSPGSESGRALEQSAGRPCDASRQHRRGLSARGCRCGEHRCC